MTSYITNLYPKPTPGSTDQRLTVDTTSGGVQLTNSFNVRTDVVYVDVQDAGVMVTFDGSAPTTTNGHLLPIAHKEYWAKSRAIAAKFIQSGATAAAVHCSEFST